MHTPFSIVFWYGIEGDVVKEAPHATQLQPVPPNFSRNLRSSNQASRNGIAPCPWAYSAADATLL